MKILALDSSGPFASVALMVDGRIVHEIACDHGLTHSQTLMPMVDQALRAAGLSCAQIDRFACVAGPGSFTGVRIGVCAVKGMAHAVGKPCIALNALEVLAMGAYGVGGTICTMLDARRDQVYAAAFRWESGREPERLLPDDALSLSTFFDRLPAQGDLYFLGDGAAVHENEIHARWGARARIAPPHMRYLRAAAACELAMLRLNQATGAEALLPIYLRAPQAERERNARLQAEGISHE